MMNDSLKKRLAVLEAKVLPVEGFCLVELSDGTTAEKSMAEWYDHRHEWRWLRMTRGGDNADIQLLLAALDEEAGVK